MAATVGKGRSLSCFTPRHLPDCKTGACLGDRLAGRMESWRAPLPVLVPCLLPDRALGHRTAGFRAVLPAEPSLPRGSPAAATRAAGSRGRGGLHGNTDVMDLESLNAASRPPPGPGAAVASLSSGWDLRGVGAATLPSAGSRPGHQKQTAVNRASQVSPASHLPDAPLSSKHSQLAASSRDLTSCFIIPRSSLVPREP